NGKLVHQEISRWIREAGPNAWILQVTLVPLVFAAALLLLYIAAAPLARRFAPALAMRAPDKVPAPEPRGGAMPVPFGGARAIAENVPYRRIALALELGAADHAVL